LTDFLNPVLDGIRFWEGLENLIGKLFHTRRRRDTSVALIDRPRIRSACPKRQVMARSRLRMVGQSPS
jgi:hypothetical protein